MKKGLLLPAALLGAILAFCLWNSAAMTAHTDRWRDQLEEADRLVRLEDWAGAAAAIRAGDRDPRPARAGNAPSAPQPQEEQRSRQDMERMRRMLAQLRQEEG